ncbi:YkgJ family cysteine cluster protein [Geomonas sp. RF6]|uniref:YkgJ family cysteine cluster protein n=1 Tax=Geomonas sp. RF6 TaxID=2897342 RepID=UPI001E3BD1EE|nr:YkgJ family cysteine cluster protein [Geomonas sp. RF6]UFS71609.1 YkgJ family cysteine cluster protein [Geomonas sp. RF6]
MECLRCGTCCVAPDISALGKRIGERCPHLSDDLTCADYGNRPAVCRGYRPDEICRMICAETLEERVEKYLALFGATAERSSG